MSWFKFLQLLWWVKLILLSHFSFTPSIINIDDNLYGSKMLCFCRKWKWSTSVMAYNARRFFHRFMPDFSFITWSHSNKKNLTLDEKLERERKKLKYFLLLLLYVFSFSFIEYSESRTNCAICYSQNKRGNLLSFAWALIVSLLNLSKSNLCCEDQIEEIKKRIPH